MTITSDWNNGVMLAYNVSKLRCCAIVLLKVDF